LTTFLDWDFSEIICIRERDEVKALRFITTILFVINLNVGRSVDALRLPETNPAILTDGIRAANIGEVFRRVRASTRANFCFFFNDFISAVSVLLLPEYAY
jgi:hypothetical protein